MNLVFFCSPENLHLFNITKVHNYVFVQRRGGSKAAAGVSAAAALA
jgi:hypothetical protein